MRAILSSWHSDALQVCSAANYCGVARNGAAVVLMAENESRDIVATFKTIPAFANQ